MSEYFLPDKLVPTFVGYEAATRERLLELRDLILDTARNTPGVGKIEETLKWGQPSFLTSESKSGSTIRIDQIKAENGQYALYFHCQTNLVDRFRELYPEQMKYEGNRAILFEQADEIPTAALQHCISLALTYHLGNKHRF